MKNKRRILVYIIIFILILSVVGCSSSQKPENPGAPASDEMDAKTNPVETSNLNEAVNVGEIVTITLDENVTTGYSWHYSIENNDLIKLDSENSQGSETNSQNSSKPDIVGAGSKHTWNFIGVKTGATKISFKYYQSWETEKSAIKTVEYTIKINESKTAARSDSGSPVASSNEAIQIVKKLLGSGNNKYIFELDHEDKVIKDDKGNYYTNRDNNSDANGIDCYIIRVYTETSKGDSVAQDNIGWYFVSKSTGMVFELKDPYDTKLKVLN